MVVLSRYGRKRALAHGLILEERRLVRVATKLLFEYMYK